MHPLVGHKAPSLTLNDAKNEPYTLSPGSNGVPMAVFFYPEAGSMGCTREACDFRDALATDLFKRSKCEVVGISGDKVTKQKKFVDEQGLNYPVLADVDGEAHKAYQTGKGLLGLTPPRITFIIDKNGIVRDVYDSVIIFNQHAKFVTKWLEKLETEPETGDKPATE